MQGLSKDNVKVEAGNLLYGIAYNKAGIPSLITFTVVELLDNNQANLKGTTISNGKEFAHNIKDNLFAYYADPQQLVAEQQIKQTPIINAWTKLFEQYGVQNAGQEEIEI